MIQRQDGVEGPRDLDHGTVPPDGRPLADQPKWRRDFPIDWAQDEYVSRRELVKFIVLTSAALVAGQFWIVLKRGLGRRPAPLAGAPIATVDELTIGGAKTFTYPEGSTPRLLVRTGANAFVAYDQQCTHLLCPVVPAVALGRLHCPCHNGWFDLQTGRPVAGPPQRPLPRVLLDVRGGTVYATGVEEPAA
ncbi:MAG: Rieske 2Fe-2S domain-containing protein [Acidobacteriota bacterium]